MPRQAIVLVEFMVLCRCENYPNYFVWARAELMHLKGHGKVATNYQHELASQINKPWYDSLYFNIWNHVYC